MDIHNDYAPLFIGIDIGGTKTAVSLGDARGKVLNKKKFPTDDHYDAVIEKICLHTEHILSARDIEQIKAIGISCGGPLDPYSGIIQSPPNLPSWDDVPIVQIIADRFNLPVYLENDANACALAELYWGNGRGCRNMIFLTFGTGLGAGLVLNGRLYSGTRGLAGEIGHFRLADEGPFCYGKAGSWEGFCSGSGLQKLFALKYGGTHTAEEICTAAGEGDAEALDVVGLSAEYLGRGIAFLVDLLNPERVIIGSIYSRNEELFRSRMEETLRREALHQAFRDCRIMSAGLGEYLGDMAALGVAIGKYGEEDRFNG
ncbi:ROK family protein [Marispirochaeta sp.]|uniref:ROK family protein n=1 Tax=Marispirochaeta sp. TaxID=2038653 RepID=UPI0029C889FD|nr:ROK family protein [Marispirochaeta sp.]